MTVFLTVLMIAAQTFKTVNTYASKYSKSEESNIEGVIGLEVLRHDLEQMGFGLFWGYLPGASVSYSESTVADSSTNDAPNVPRAFVALNDSAIFSSDFFGLKGTSLNNTKASQRWSYIPFHNLSTSSGWDSRPVSWPSNNLKAGSGADVVIAIRNNFNDPDDDHLLLDAAGAYGFNFNNTGGINDAYLPTKDQQVSMIYGIDSSSPRMPFNRADFFISTTAGTVPTFCAPSTGVLYKATVNSAGGYTYIPLLDCVADMQVVLGWDTSDKGSANSVAAYSNADGTVVSGGTTTDIQGWLTSPQRIREHLKMVKVYILAQEGKQDPNYTYPSATFQVSDLGEVSLTKPAYAFTAAQRQYSWKLYRLIVRPKNLKSNQQ